MIAILLCVAICLPIVAFVLAIHCDPKKRLVRAIAKRLVKRRTERLRRIMESGASDPPPRFAEGSRALQEFKGHVIRDSAGNVWGIHPTTGRMEQLTKVSGQ